MNSQDLEAIIRQKVQDVKTLVVSDVSGGCGQAFDVIIVSPVFEGLSTLKRHRMVNDLLKDQIAQLHAFSQKTYTPAQYQALSGSDNAITSPTPASATASTAAPASTSMTPSSSLLPQTPPSKTTRSASSQGSKFQHNRSTSNVSIPELTLTTDDETLSGRAHAGAPRPLTPSTQPGGTTSSLDMYGHSGHGGSPSSPAGGGISRLHYAKITSVEFWDEIKRTIDAQLLSAGGSPAVPSGTGGGDNPLLASPGHAGGSGSSPRGEAEATRLFEDFFQSQKFHMSASDVAKVRDGTGMYGM